MLSLLTVDAAETLRDYLDQLNELGKMPGAVGLDAKDTPFLAVIVGIYADGVDVFIDSPWSTDADYGTRGPDGVWTSLAPRCDECRGVAHTLADLTYPVILLAAGIR